MEQNWSPVEPRFFPAVTPCTMAVDMDLLTADNMWIAKAREGGAAVESLEIGMNRFFAGAAGLGNLLFAAVLARKSSFSCLSFG